MSFFDWLFGRRRPASAAAGSPPPTCSDNPGRAASGKVTFRHEGRSRTEVFHVAQIAAEVLTRHGHQVDDHGSWLELRPSGLILQPLMVELEPRDDGTVRTVTTIDVRHPELNPDGLFEYQHAIGDTVAAALADGFEGFESVDLPVLLDALRPQPEACGALEMALPTRDGRPARVRRAIVGSVSCFAAASQPAADAEAEHPFCSCCFLTKNFEAFRSHLEGDGCFAIRFYAARNTDGTASADCRVNGLDYEPGMESLRAYVATWPGSGLEFRKQYVLIHTPRP